MTEIIPLDDRAVLKVRKMDEKTEGGIVLPPEYRDKMSMAQLEAEVVAVGEHCFIECKVRPMPGDTVLITRYAGLLYTINGEEYRLVTPRDIIGIKK